jgi:hypothetical protein
MARALASDTASEGSGYVDTAKTRYRELSYRQLFVLGVKKESEICRERNAFRAPQDDLERSGLLGGRDTSSGSEYADHRSQHPAARGCFPQAQKAANRVYQEDPGEATRRRPPISRTTSFIRTSLSLLSSIE